MEVKIFKKNKYNELDSLNIYMGQDEVDYNDVYKFIIELLAKELNIKEKEINYDDGNFWIDIKLKKYEKWYEIWFQSTLLNTIYKWNNNLEFIYNKCKDYYDNGCCNIADDYFDYDYVKENW